MGRGSLTEPRPQTTMNVCVWYAQKPSPAAGPAKNGSSAADATAGHTRHALTGLPVMFVRIASKEPTAWNET